MALLTISESADSYIQFMTVLILFVLVLAITYYATRWMAGYQKSRVSGSCRSYVSGRNIWQWQSVRILLQC